MFCLPLVYPITSLPGQAECATGHQPSWNKNLTCEECVKKVDKEIHAREPDAACEDKEAKAFLKSNCEASANTFNCKHSFEAECGTQRPPWTANLTCDECVRTIDSDIRRRDPTANCDEAARVFVKDGCKDTPRSLDCKKEFEMECNNTARPDWNKNLTCEECVKALDEAIHKRDPTASCDKEARVFDKTECKKAHSDGCKNDASEYCCPDAKHCLTPTEKTCGEAGDKCAASEVCCPLTKLCVTAGAACVSPCPATSYCCPHALKCLTPTNPGTLCDPSDDTACKTGELCCPLTKECVIAGSDCKPPLAQLPWL